MKVLIAGAGVIGTVYGAHLAGAWHAVSVLNHRPGQRMLRGTG
jgi:ketopantoate reductase